MRERVGRKLPRRNEEEGGMFPRRKGQPYMSSNGMRKVGARGQRGGGKGQEGGGKSRPDGVLRTAWLTEF